MRVVLCGVAGKGSEGERRESWGIVKNYKKDGDGYVLEKLGNWVLLHNKAVKQNEKTGL